MEHCTGRLHFAHIAAYFWHQCVANSITHYDIEDWERLAKAFETASGYWDYDPTDF